MPENHQDSYIKPPMPNEVMAPKLDALITRFDQNGDETLNLDELKSAKEKATTDVDKQTIDFAQRYFGVLSILGSESDAGISRRDVREFGRTEWKPERFPKEIGDQMKKMYEELYRIDNQ